MKSIRLLWIELEGYSLLHLSAIQRIKIDFTQRFHWILGMNGTGKSSIIRESTPLMFDQSKFNEGGFKKTRWTVGEDVYELTSTKGAKRHLHSFCKIHEDGSKEELNPGFTSTVYQALVEQIFGVTKESHQVAIGKIRFTEMDGAARKTLFTNLSAVDYTYALGYYKRLYTSYRDLRGSIKTDKERLIEISAVSTAREDEKKLLEEIAGLKKQVESLLNIRPNASGSPLELKKRIDEIKGEIQHCFDRMRSHSKANKHLYPIGDMDVLKATLARYEAQFDHTEKVIDEKYRTFNELTSKVIEMRRNGSQDTKALEIEQEALLAKIKEFSYKLLKSKVDTAQATLEVERALTEVHDVVATMTPIDPEELDQERALTIQRDNYTQEAISLDSRIQNYALQIEEIKKHEHAPDINCPKCGHGFNPNFNVFRLRGLEDELGKAKRLRDDIGNKLEEINSTLLKLKRFHQGHANFFSFIQRFPTLTDAWSATIESKDHYLDPSQTVSNLTTLRLDLVSRSKEDDIRNQLAEVSKRLDWSRKTSEDDLKKTEAEVNTLEKALEDLYTQRNKDLDTLRYLKSKIALGTFLQNTAETAKKLKDELEACLVNQYDHLERHHLSSFIMKLNVEITEREERLRQLSSKASEIIRLETMIKLTEGRSKALKDALKVLSPTEGMIAKGLTGFINHFTGLMNNVIERIMAYEMKILPLVPSNEDFELDYKFPMKVADGHADDPSDLSKGQAEIVDLAFRIVYAHFAKLAGGPLILDEFGSNLDHGHRQKAFDAVRRMLDITNFSQIFMISHMSNTYNLMDGAGVTVLSPANIEVPEGIVHNATTDIVRI